MYFILVLIIASVGAIGIFKQFGLNEYTNSAAATNGDVFRHELFSRTAERYMQLNPSSSGTLTWTNINKYTSSSFKSITYPSTFRVVIVSPGTYYICGKLKNHAAATKVLQNDFGMVTIPLGKGGFITSKTQAIADANRSNCEAVVNS